MHKTALKQKIILVIFGLVLSMVIIEIGLRVAGFVYLSLIEQRNKISLKKGVYRIMCLGDSTTALGGKDSYPSQLEKFLNNSIPSRHFVVINKGIPGTDTSTIVSELRYNLDIYKPDMVITMMGINSDACKSPFKTDTVFFIKKFIKSLRMYKLGELLLARMRERQVLSEKYLECARGYLDLEHYPEAKKMLEKAGSLSPKNALAYVRWGYYYYKQNDNTQSLAMLQRAEELAGDSKKVYGELGWCYSEMKKYAEAEAMFKKAIALAPKDQDVYCDAAQFYLCISRYAEAEAMFKKVITIAPQNEQGYVELGWYYFERNMFAQAGEMLKKALRITGERLDIYRDLGYFKQVQGMHEEAKEYFNKARPFIDYARTIIARNYRILKDIVLGRGIKLVCVQYPMRPLVELKNLFVSSEGITFVDNEKIFKDALRACRYEDYFEDRFGGDFGHCTPKGNSLLANNIAEVILKKHFRDQGKNDINQ